MVQYAQHSNENAYNRCYLKSMLRLVLVSSIEREVIKNILTHLWASAIEMYFFFHLQLDNIEW